MAKSKYTPQERKNIIQAALRLRKQGGGLTNREIAEQLGVSSELLRVWLRAETLQWLLPTVPNMGRIR
jgi:transposase-like protein